MNTPPPCTGGQIGYGDTNSTWRADPRVRGGPPARLASEWSPPGPASPCGADPPVRAGPPDPANSNSSRKYPPIGLRKASASVTTASRFARDLETIARGNCSVAHASPARLARSGESPATQLNSACAQL